MSAGAVTSIRCSSRRSGSSTERRRLRIARVGDPRRRRVAVVDHPRRDRGVLGQPGAAGHLRTRLRTQQLQGAGPAARDGEPGGLPGRRSAAPRTSGRCPWTPRSDVPGEVTVGAKEGGHAGSRLGHRPEDVVGAGRPADVGGTTSVRVGWTPSICTSARPMARVVIGNGRHLDPQPVGAYAVEVDDRLPGRLVGLDPHLLAAGDEPPGLDRLQAERRPRLHQPHLPQGALGPEVDVDPLALGLRERRRPPEGLAVSVERGPRRRLRPERRR